MNITRIIIATFVAIGANSVIVNIFGTLVNPFFAGSQSSSLQYVFLALGILISAVASYIAGRWYFEKANGGAATGATVGALMFAVSFVQTILFTLPGALYQGVAGTMFSNIASSFTSAFNFSMTLANIFATVAGVAVAGLMRNQK